MKIAAVIAEFNPFHNGHAYLFDTIKHNLEADYLIIAMSGDYVQRGEPAIFSKHFRCEQALKAGADLVFELPNACATGSAEYFARGAVGLLHHLGIVDTLYFGSEAGSLEQLELQTNPTTPNDILGIEYLKALTYFSSSITPCPLPRLGAGYHDTRIHTASYGNIASASFLRQKIQDSLARIDKNDAATWQACIPENLAKDLFDYIEKHQCLSFASLDQLLYYKLTAEQKKGYEEYFDVYADLSCKIKANLESYIDAASFRETLKSREISFAHLSRSLLHIVLDISKEEMHSLKQQEYCPYLRLLGFRKSAAPVLKEIKQSSQKHLISKLADAPSYLSAEAQSILEKDTARSHLYQKLAQKNPDSILSEYRRGLYIFED